MDIVTLVGNLTRDPEIRYTTGGKATAGCGIAVNRGYKDRTTEEWVDAVSFFNVVLWDDLAEHAAASLHKGDRVIVTGRLTHRTYENDKGDTVPVVEVVAKDIGASVRWATLQVARVSRQSADALPQA